MSANIELEEGAELRRNEPGVPAVAPHRTKALNCFQSGLDLAFLFRLTILILTFLIIVFIVIRSITGEHNKTDEISLQVLKQLGDALISAPVQGMAVAHDQLKWQNTTQR